jgi:beta-lactam-binding protein with PASTA domain
LANAETQLTSQRLLYEFVYRCSKIHLRPGRVTSQSPTAGTRTRTGSEVILTVSTRQTCH